MVDGSQNVEIVVPPRAPEGLVEQMLADHRGWLERQLAKPPRPFRLGLQRRDCVWIGGLAMPLPAVVDLAAWYRGEARHEAGRVLAEEADRIGVSYRALAIRDQRTRWGSCSATGTLSFNWRLVIAPHAVLRYVVVHELCHRLRHDHSRAFWQLVAQHRPTHKDEKAWLDEHGPELLAYRVPTAWSGGRPSTATAR